VKGGVALLLLWYPITSSLLHLVSPEPKEIEWRPLLTVIAEQARPGDVLYIEKLDHPCFRYYSERLELARRVSVKEMPCAVEGGDASDLDWLPSSIPASGRAWFLFTYFPPRISSLFSVQTPDETVMALNRIRSFDKVMSELAICEASFEAPGAKALRYRPR
jgi:hypothetical protein